MGRRWGKTVWWGVGRRNAFAAWAGSVDCTDLQEHPPMWRWLLAALADDAKHKRVQIHKAERTIETRKGWILGHVLRREH